MNKTTAAILGLTNALILSAGEAPYLRAERPSAVYKTGETIIFTVKKYVPNAIYTVYDGKTVSKPAPLTKESVNVKAKMPGFILVKVHYGKNSKDKDLFTYAGAAVEPEKICPGTTCPSDFDSFWNNELRKLRANPLVIIEKPVDTKLLPDGISAYDVMISRGDVTATGYVAFPVNAKAKSLPGCLTFLGASKITAELPIALNFAKKGNALCFNLNFHGLINHWPRNPDITKASKKTVAKYNQLFAEDQQKYAMRKIFLRTVLAAEYLMQRKEYNGQKLVSYGGSLGGCQALVCSALVPQVTYCVSQATAMCDHHGKKAGHLPGWPNLLAIKPEAANNSAYFDVVNFMHRVKCPVFMAVGFIDVTCPPASTYAAYNTLKVSDKKMQHSVTSGHGGKCLDSKDTGVFHIWEKEIIAYLNGKAEKTK